MRRKKNITLNLRSTIPYFTGKQKIITLCFIILILSLVNITLCFSNYNNTSALNYSSNVGIGFTFNPTLSISLSSNDLVIPNLVPGSTEDSNSIDVSVATNAAYGYTLSAIINGNNNNLTHTNGTNTFSSIATNSSLPNLVTDNTWGYSYKLSNDTNWNNYSGLSNETSKTLVDSNDQTAIPIDFKIGAKASSTQASGTYTGTINFTAVSNVAPMSLLDSFIASGAEQLNGYYKMQNMTHDICNNVDIEESELQLIDVRDNKIYWVAKLKDGNCWMTQNLELDLIANSTILNSTNTNINVESYNPDSGTYSPAGGYSKDDNTNIVTWSPERSTTISLGNGNFPSTTEANSIPYSYNPGDKYYYPSSSGDDHIYTLALCEAQGYMDCQHYKAGNYYNWSAAVASNNTSSLTSHNKSADNSICPKGWILPKSFPANDFDALGAVYNINNGTALNLRIPPLYFVRSGSILGDRIYAPSNDAHYWSSTPSGGIYAYNLLFYSSQFTPSMQNGRYFGFSVRCIAE